MVFHGILWYFAVFRLLVIQTWNWWINTDHFIPIKPLVQWQILLKKLRYPTFLPHFCPTFSFNFAPLTLLLWSLHAPPHNCEPWKGPNQRIQIHNTGYIRFEVSKCFCLLLLSSMRRILLENSCCKDSWHGITIIIKLVQGGGST